VSVVTVCVVGYKLAGRGRRSLGTAGPSGGSASGIVGTGDGGGRAITISIGIDIATGDGDGNIGGVGARVVTVCISMGCVVAGARVSSSGTKDTITISIGATNSAATSAIGGAGTAIGSTTGDIDCSIARITVDNFESGKSIFAFVGGGRCGKSGVYFGIGTDSSVWIVIVVGIDTV
jgi:hypothetical protein